jgi:hypothetical protein
MRKMKKGKMRKKSRTTFTLKESLLSLVGLWRLILSLLEICGLVVKFSGVVLARYVQGSEGCFHGVFTFDLEICSKLLF